jgi:hypothetical protein
MSRSSLQELFSCLATPATFFVPSVRRGPPTANDATSGLPTIYNVIAIPAPACLFIRWGLKLPMSVRVLAMKFSTVIVALNAQFLRRVKLGH